MFKYTELNTDAEAGRITFTVETDAETVDLITKLAGDAMKEAAYKVQHWAYGDLTLEDVDPNAESADEFYRSIAEASELENMADDLAYCMELFFDSTKAASEADEDYPKAQRKLEAEIAAIEDGE